MRVSDAGGGGPGVRNDKSLIGREIGAEASEIWHRTCMRGRRTLVTPAAAVTRNDTSYFGERRSRNNFLQADIPITNRDKSVDPFRLADHS